MATSLKWIKKEDLKNHTNLKVIPKSEIKKYKNRILIKDINGNPLHNHSNNFDDYDQEVEEVMDVKIKDENKKIIGDVQDNKIDKCDDADYDSEEDDEDEFDDKEAEAEEEEEEDEEEDEYDDNV